jgi:PAS domain S-box-containing protein
VEAECNDFQELRKELFRLRERQQLIEAAFESAYEGIVLVDPDGKIVMLNDTYARFLQVDARKVIGRHVTEVIENIRMHIVVRTGRPELAQVQRIRGGDMLVHRIPIRKNNRVVSAVGKVLFQDVNKLHALSRRVMQLSKELDYYRGEYFKKLGIRYRFDDIAGKSEAMLRVRKWRGKWLGVIPRFSSGAKAEPEKKCLPMPSILKARDGESRLLKSIVPPFRKAWWNRFCSGMKRGRYRSFPGRQKGKVSPRGGWHDFFG